MKLKREELLMKMGAAKQRSPSAWRLVKSRWTKINRLLLTGSIERSYVVNVDENFDPS